MKKIAIRIGILLGVFVITVALTVLLMNSESTDNMGDMDEPTLPVVLVDFDDTLTNRMYGYAQPMQVDFNRDSLTPIDTKRQVSLAIKANDNDIKGLVYEIRTSDGSRVVENQKVNSFTEKDGYQRATLEFTSNKMLMNQEYSLQIELETEDGKAYYYTRVIQRSGLNTAQYVEFVQGFYQKCLNKEAIAELGQYLEPNSNQANSDYTSVNIHSSMDAATWGNLSPQISRQGVPLIKDMNETTGSVSIYYQIAAKNDEGEMEYYEVEDFYRMRYTQSKVMLLDFEREAQQIFDGNLEVADAQGITLGIVDQNIPFIVNSSADTVAFVQGGELWSYSHSGSKFTRIFSFRREEGGDERDYNNAHNMKLLRVDEAGDMDFVLYGYMNRGPHEGYVGTSVYHYSSSQNAVEELIFIPSTLSYEFLSRDLDKLCYVNESGRMYMLTEGNLYEIDFEDRTYEVIQEGIENNCFFTSNTNASVGWMSQMEENSSTAIARMDLDSGKRSEIKVDAGQYVKALGFMNEDLVYGVTREENVVETSDGKELFAIDIVRIEGFDGTVKKEVSQDGRYITNVLISDLLMNVQYSDWENDQYVYKTSENIMNNKKAVEEAVTLNSVFTDRRGIIRRFDFNQAVSSPNPVLVSSKVKAEEENITLDMEISPQDNEVYYVYARGMLDNIYSDPAEAIIRADEVTGVVLNRKQQYVWERGNLRNKIQINQEDIPEAILEGSPNAKKLQESLPEGKVLNLTECTLEQVLYQVSAQRPVIAAIKGGILVIVGYDQYNTLVYDPTTKETRYMGLEDSTRAFQEGGNIFITYMENLEE